MEEQKKTLKEKKKAIDKLVNEQKVKMAKAKAKEVQKKSENQHKLVEQANTIKINKQNFDQYKKLVKQKMSTKDTQIHALTRLAVPENHD